MLPEGLFACIVAVVLPVRAWLRFRRGAPPASTIRYVLETTALIAALAALLWRRGVAADALGLAALGSWRLAADLVICVGVVVAIDAWSFWRATRRLRQAATFSLPEELFDDALAGGRRLAPFVLVCIVGAIWEELCFRATVLLLVPQTPVGLLAGALTGSLLFGAQHLRNGRDGLVYAFFFGLMFSALFIATGDLIATIVAHAAGNILAAAHWAPRLQRARQAAARRPSPIFMG